ncbi:MAG TPA: PilN domain-containing protein [Candidatus Angelobacter sp.]
MRLNINLASVKYEDVRRFYLRWGTALVVASLLTIVLAVLAAYNQSRSSQTNREIRELQQKISELEKKRAEAEAFENSPENRDVTEQKNFWNAQIAKRSLSWTQLFNDLQKIMPGRAYVISVAPELTQDNRLKLKLMIGAEQYANAIDLVKRMETSPRFRQPQITSEVVQKDQRTGVNTFRLDIETYYTPAGLMPHASSKEGL